MGTVVLHYFLLWKPLGYALIFVGMIFEGDIFVFTSFFLARQGFLDFSYITLTIFSGVLFGDLIWYWSGIYLSSSQWRFGQLANKWFGHFTRPFEGHLIKRPFHTIFFSKFVYGVHHPLLLRAGALGMNISKYIKLDILAIILWMVIIGILGYFAGAYFYIIRHYVRIAEFGLVVGIVIFIAGSHFLSNYLKKRL